MPSSLSALPDLGQPIVIDRLICLGSKEKVAGAVTVERTEQPLLLDHLPQGAITVRVDSSSTNWA